MPESHRQLDSVKYLARPHLVATETTYAQQFLAHCVRISVTCSHYPRPIASEGTECHNSVLGQLFEPGTGHSSAFPGV
jgi:hypothetical protein